MTRFFIAGMTGLSFVSGGAAAHGGAHAKKAERNAAKRSGKTSQGREGEPGHWEAGMHGKITVNRK